jgi:condensin complex subunit 2
MATENADPQVSAVYGNSIITTAKPPLLPSKTKKNVSISPKNAIRLSSSPIGSGGGRRRGLKNRRSSSHFQVAANDDEDDDDDDDEDIEFTLDGANDIEGDDDDNEEHKSTNKATPKSNNNTNKQQQRRRRRSSARFLRLSNGGGGGEKGHDGQDNDQMYDTNNEDGNNNNNNYTSSEHLGEIYRQAIRMNAENKINAGNSWGLKLIENMDKFLNVDETTGDGASDENLTPRGGNTEEGARNDLRVARKMKSKDDKGRINFTKASCTLDASVKIYSYRVDDVHLSSYRVLANLNRTDTNNKKDDGDEDGVLGTSSGDGEDGGGGQKTTSKRRTGPKGPTQTIETNKGELYSIWFTLLICCTETYHSHLLSYLIFHFNIFAFSSYIFMAHAANINMSKLDSAYDIDPLFHKMSKAFDEGGAKGLLLGNLGVAQNGCHIVFDSKEIEEVVNDKEAANGNVDEEKNEDNDDDKKKMEEFGINPEEAVVWKESEIDITSFAAKLESMLASYGAQTTASVPFVPQLESLREDYATLEREGYAVDEKDNNMTKDGRKRLRLYDAPEDEEKEAERSIHVIASERSRASILGTSILGMSFGLSMDMGDGEDDNEGGEAINFNAEDLGGEGEFAPDDGSYGGGGEGEFAPDFGSPAGSGGGGFGDARSYKNTKTLLDALCDADAFYEGSDYAFFDVKKFEKATDGNLWAGSQHWKKSSVMAKKNPKKADEKKKVMFENDDEEEGPKKQRKKAVKKDRVFVDFNTEPDVDAIFQKKKSTKKTKKTPKDPFQMAKTEKDFLLPTDANVDITQLTRLFSRPNAVVRRSNNDADNNKPIGKTVGFYDVEENALGFNDNDDGDFGGDDAGDGGFNFAYDDDANEPESDDVDYNTDNFDEVRKVEKIDINYAQVAKKVDVRRLKKDLWTELEEKTAWIKPDDFSDKADEAKEEDDEDDMYEDPRPKKGEPQYVSFKETCEKLDNTQGQHGVTVSFYFICCLHLANEKGLKFDSNGLDDFMISLDDGSAPTFGTFGDGFTETVDKLKSRGSNRDKKVASYVEGDGEE